MRIAIPTVCLLLTLAASGCSTTPELGEGALDQGLTGAGGPAQPPGPMVRGTPRWHADPKSPGLLARIFGNRSSSPGYYDGFLTCFAVTQMASSCGNEITISQGETVTIGGSGSIEIPNVGSLGASVSKSYTFTYSDTVGSGPCETCWPVICFNTESRKWDTPEHWVSAGFQGVRIPASTHYDTTYANPRASADHCAPEPTCPGCADGGSEAQDAGVADPDGTEQAGTGSDVGRSASPLIDGPDVDDALSAPGRTWQAVFEVARADLDDETQRAVRCELSRSRDLLVERDGETFDSLMIVWSDAFEHYPGDARFDCPPPTSD